MTEQRGQRGGPEVLGSRGLGDEGEHAVAPGVWAVGRQPEAALAALGEELRAAGRALLEQHARRLRDVGGRLAAAHDEERRALARALHDDLARRLGGLAVELTELQHLRLGGTPRAERVRRLRGAVQGLADELRGLAWRLDPALREPLGLAVALQALAAEAGQRSRLRVRYLQRGGVEGLPLDAASVLYRVAQEGLEELRRHEATRATLLLVGHERFVGLCVRGDAAGAGGALGEPAPPGLRLLDLRERMVARDGYLRVRGRPGGGTEVHAWLPRSGAPPPRGVGG